jgi:hypothetical protein
MFFFDPFYSAFIENRLTECLTVLALDFSKARIYSPVLQSIVECDGSQILSGRR